MDIAATIRRKVQEEVTSQKGVVTALRKDLSADKAMEESAERRVETLQGKVDREKAATRLERHHQKMTLRDAEDDAKVNRWHGH